GGGSLTWNGAAVSAGQVITAASISAGKLVFTPAAEVGRGPCRGFAFTVSDGATASGAATESVNVTPLAPTTSNNTVTTTEGSAYNFRTSDFPLTDPDSDGETLQSVTITNLPGTGSLTLNGAAVSAGQVITAASISAGKLVFTPAP